MQIFCIFDFSLKIRGNINETMKGIFTFIETNGKTLNHVKTCLYLFFYSSKITVHQIVLKRLSEPN